MNTFGFSTGISDIAAWSHPFSQKNWQLRILAENYWMEAKYWIVSTNRVITLSVVTNFIDSVAVIPSTYDCECNIGFDVNGGICTGNI